MTMTATEAEESRAAKLARKAWRGVLAMPVCAVVIGPCSKKPEDSPPPPQIVSATATVPPVAFSGAPAVESFADAASIDGKTPYDQARTYEANGQYWLARLVLEKKALGPDGTKAEIELLASLCHQQGDEACVETCGTKLGRKLKFDGGVPSRTKLDAGEHKEPDSDAARARDLLLKHKLKEARDILEPKVIDNKASKDEIRLLRNVCKEQGDRMCMALCDAKLK